MNYRAELTAPFGDGEYAFKLTVAAILELEEKAKSPFAVIFMRLASSTYGFVDVFDTIRLGLIGGGMPAVKAKVLAERYVMPLAESAPIARLILSGVMFGFEVSPPGKETAAPTEKQRPSASTPPSSTEAHIARDSVPMSLDEFLSTNFRASSRLGTPTMPHGQTSSQKHLQ